MTVMMALMIDDWLSMIDDRWLTIDDWWLTIDDWRLAIDDDDDDDDDVDDDDEDEQFERWWKALKNTVDDIWYKYDEIIRYVLKDSRWRMIIASRIFMMLRINQSGNICKHTTLLHIDLFNSEWFIDAEWYISETLNDDDEGNSNNHQRSRSGWCECFCFCCCCCWCWWSCELFFLTLHGM